MLILVLFAGLKWSKQVLCSFWTRPAILTRTLSHFRQEGIKFLRKLLPCGGQNLQLNLCTLPSSRQCPSPFPEVPGLRVSAHLVMASIGTRLLSAQTAVAQQRFSQPATCPARGLGRAGLRWQSRSLQEWLYSTQPATVNNEFESSPHMCGLKKHEAAKKIQRETLAVSSACNPCPVSVTECAHKHAQAQAHSCSALEAQHGSASGCPVFAGPALCPTPQNPACLFTSALT